MKFVTKHIETAVIPGRAGASYSPMYSMHKYWSKKPSEIIRKYIDTYTTEGDIVLDPFSGYGVTILEALKLGRKAICIDLNPVATFITRVILEPVNLSRLMWSFRDVQKACEHRISELFTTKCTECGRKGTVDFVVRQKNDPLKIGYTCSCASKRLFKDPDEYDIHVDEMISEMEIPFWYPENIPLPTTQKEKFGYVHELFTRRNLIALSMILNEINNIDNRQLRNVVKLAFSACLDKCSRLKPLSTKSREASEGHPTLSEGWVASRFYTPPIWQEVNPWLSFALSFKRIYDGKRESNELLRNVVIGSRFEELKSGRANVIVIQGSAQNILANELPEDCIDYVLTDPPFGSAIQYLTLSTFWGAWLGFTFDYESEIVVDTRRKKTKEDYYGSMKLVFQNLKRVMKPGGYLHVFFNDIEGPYLHKMLTHFEETGLTPQHITHQPPPNSFGVVVRTERKGNYGSYVIRAQVTDVSSLPVHGVAEDELRHKLRNMARRILANQDGEATVATILHSAYRNMGKDEISTFKKYLPEKFLEESIKDFAKVRKKGVTVLEGHEEELSGLDVTGDLRRYILDASSLLPDETDSKNRVRQIALVRLQDAGVTLEKISQVKISKEEQRAHDVKHFADLLCLFGNKLGYQSKYPGIKENVVTWTKENLLDLNFDLSEKDIIVFSSIKGSGKHKFPGWGSILRIKLEKKIWEWCMNNRDKSEDLLGLLFPLDGPSYELLTQDNQNLDSFRHLKMTVLKNVKVCPMHNLMQMQLPNVKFKIKPGQFFHIICDPGKSDEPELPLTLRRPFSIHGAQYETFDRSLLAKSSEMPKDISDILERWPSKIDIMYKIVGEGTSRLSQLTEGTVLDAIGPCGNGFSMRQTSKAIIVAGGIGIAPLIALVEQLRYLNREVYIYLGALSRDFLNLAIRRPDSDVELSFANGNKQFIEVVREDFREIGANNLRVCTDDGSVGDKGLVTQLLDHDFSVRKLPRNDICIYACGPHNMLQSVANLAEIYSVECQVLLEERMACGVGACLSCVCDVVKPDGSIQKKRVCRDGPVFNAREIKWKDYTQR